MNSLQDNAAIAASTRPPGGVARRSRRKTIGLLLCVSALVVVAAWGVMAFSSGVTLLLPILTPSTQSGRWSVTLRANAAAPSLLNPARLIKA